MILHLIGEKERGVSIVEPEYEREQAARITAVDRDQFVAVVCDLARVRAIACHLQHRRRGAVQKEAPQNASNARPSLSDMYVIMPSSHILL